MGKPELLRPRLVKRPLDQKSGVATLDVICERERLFEMLDDLAALLCRIGKAK